MLIPTDFYRRNSVPMMKFRGAEKKCLVIKMGYKLKNKITISVGLKVKNTDVYEDNSH